MASYLRLPSSPGGTAVGATIPRSSSSPALHMAMTRNLHLSEGMSLAATCSNAESHTRADTCHMLRSRSAGNLRGEPLLPRRHSSSDLKKISRQKPVWRMEVADPLESFRDSFGNECVLELRARKDLETTDAYCKLTSAMDEVRGRMKRLVSEELYEEAAQVRDTLNMLEFRKRLLELSAKPRVLYRVGDVIVHRKYGYRGVVYGHDPLCSAPQDWQEAMKIELLPEGREQPFYHILVDTRDRPGGMSTYVAQESMVLHKMERPVVHPWIPKFFVGFQDATYVPGPKLRQVYPNDW